MNVLDMALNIGIAAVTLAVLLCAVRLLRGPTPTDRVLALAASDELTRPWALLSGAWKALATGYSAGPGAGRRHLP